MAILGASDRDQRPSPLLPGATVGPYRLEAQLSASDVGSVWLVRHRGDVVARHVAKLVAADRAADVQRLAAEARLLLEVPSAALPAMEEWLPAGRDGWAMLVLGRRAGRDLAHALVDASVARIVAVGAAALRALRSTHAAGVVHGDLHIGNLLVDEAGHVSLLDLGLAAPIGSGAPVGPGFPGTAAPERLRLEPVDVRDDLFALAATLWSALGLGSPYPDYPAVLPRDDERVDVPPQSPTQRLPEPLLGVLASMLRPRRAQRPADADAALRAWIVAASSLGIEVDDDTDAALAALALRPWRTTPEPLPGGNLVVVGPAGSGKSAVLRGLALGQAGPHAWLRGADGIDAIDELLAATARLVGPLTLATVDGAVAVEGGLVGVGAAEQARFDALLDATLRQLGPQGWLLVDDLELLPAPVIEAVHHVLDGPTDGRARLAVATTTRPALVEPAIRELGPAELGADPAGAVDALAQTLLAADGGRDWDLGLVRAIWTAIEGVRGRIWPLVARLGRSGALQRGADRVESKLDEGALADHLAGLIAQLESPPPPPPGLLGLLAHVLVDPAGLRAVPGDPAPVVATADVAAWPWLRALPAGGWRLDRAAVVCAAAAVGEGGQAVAAAQRAAFWRDRDPDRALALRLFAASHGIGERPQAAEVVVVAQRRIDAGDSRGALDLGRQWLERQGIPLQAIDADEAAAAIGLWTETLRAAMTLGRFDAVDALTPLAPPGARRDVNALLVQAEAAFRRGDFPQARVVADAVLAAGAGDVADVGSWSRQVVIAQTLACFAATWQGDLDAARAGVVRGLNASSPWPELRAQIDYLDALLRYYAGEIEAARLRFDALVRADVAPAITAAAWAGLGLCAQRAGDLHGARRGYDESRRLAERAGDRARVLNMTMNLATLDHEAGDLGRALAGYDRVVVAAERLGNVGAGVRARANRGNLRWLLGLVDEACADLDAALPALQASGNAYLEGNVACVLAELERAAGRLGPAAAWIGRAEATLTAVGASNELAEIRLESAWLAMARGEVDAALEIAEAVEADAGRRQQDELVARALHVRARAAMARLGEEGLATREVARLLDAAIGQLADAAGRLPAGKVVMAVRFDTDRAWLLAAAGRRADAKRLAIAARERLDRIAATLSLALRRRFVHAAAFAAVRDVLGLCARLDEAAAGGTEQAPGRAAERAVLALAQRLSAEHDPERLLETLMDSAVALTGAERGFLLLDARDGEPETPATAADLEVAIARNLDGENLRKPQHKLSRGMALEVFESGEPILATDARLDPRFAEQQSVHAGNLRSIVCVPLNLRGRTIGVLYVDNRFAAGAFSREHATVLESLASQAAVAIHTARLIRRLRQREVELEQSRGEVVALNAKLEAELASTEDALSEARRQLVTERGEAARRSDYDQIRGDSPEVHQMFRLLDRVRDHDFPVLVIGESGTGKELVARAVHFSGRRKHGPFVAINCGALPESLLESELFGHVKGAFTGAAGDRRGLFEQAHGGTLFLDEIGEMPASMQVKLLRVLQTGELTRVGGAGVIQVDVRVVAATHRDLDRMVRDGSFREDLLYRLRVVDIAVPPLRARPGDLEVLCEHFLQRNREAGLGKVRRITKGALRRMRAYAWPGNVRELETFLKSACLFAESDTLDVADVAPLLDRATGKAARRTGGGGGGPALTTEGTLADLERMLVLGRLEQLGGNKRKTAESLGIDRGTLYNKLRSWGEAADG